MEPSHGVEVATSAVATGRSRSEIFGIAEERARDLGFEPGAGLEEVVTALGGEIVFLETSEITSSTGSMLVRPDKTFVVFISRYTSRTRDRFTTAHEIGHFVLHLPVLEAQGVPGPWAFNRHGTNRAEVEANWFAAAFLMPADRFEAAHSQRNGDLMRIAWDFEVSHESARIRAESLGLVTPS